MNTIPTSVRNRLWVTRYARAIALLGVLMLIGGVVHGAISAFHWHARTINGWLAVDTFFYAVTLSLNGFLALGLANFLMYILGVRQQPSWILKCADKGLYLLAACRFLGYALTVCNDTIMSTGYWSICRIGLRSMLSIPGALILVTLGLILRRMLPIIKESRTLV